MSKIVVRDSPQQLRMELFTGEIISGLLAHSLHTAAISRANGRMTGAGPGSRSGEFIDWLTIKDQSESVVADVECIKTHPLVPRHIPVYGYIDQLETGRLVEVSEATQAGGAR
jgi:carbonic anhydrase